MTTVSGTDSAKSASNQKRALVLNAGSSSLKFSLIDVDITHAGGGTDGIVTLASGIVDKIGSQADITTRIQEKSQTRPAQASNYGEAVALALHALQSVLPAGTQLSDTLDAVGHRVVHGGSKFSSPTLISDKVINELDALSELAPLHNPPAIECLRATRTALGPELPMLAVFDTAFHAGLPQHASTYALPKEVAARHEIRRYGFHGIAHEYMLRRYAHLAGKRPDEATIITLQLGNGCSACAISKGRSVDTSMGFTPLEGLVMGTRSGDLDPGLVGYLAAKEGVSVDDIEAMLNRRSGLLGLSGHTNDMRELLTLQGSDQAASLAVDVFCYRVKKYIGAYLAALGGAEAVVFGGGIGENAASIRAKICAGLEWAGLRLEPSLNGATPGIEGRVSAPGSLAAYVVKVDEDVLIARYAVSMLHK